MLNPNQKFSFSQKIRRKSPFQDQYIDMIALYESHTGNPLRQIGSKHVGLCPFHSEDTPSFTIFPDTQSVYCFGCQFSAKASWFKKKLEEL